MESNISSSNILMVKYLAVLEIILKVMNKKLFMYLLLNNSLPEDSPSKEAESEDK